MSTEKDYIEYLQPIIDDVKDGSDENLTLDDVKFILKVISAKIKFKEGLISKNQYDTEISSATISDDTFTDSDMLSQDIISSIFGFHGYDIEVTETYGSSVVIKDLRTDEETEIEVDELINQDSDAKEYLI